MKTQRVNITIGQIKSEMEFVNWKIGEEKLLEM